MGDFAPWALTLGMGVAPGPQWETLSQISSAGPWENAWIRLWTLPCTVIHVTVM